MRTYYVGMDVHGASIVIVVLNGAGKVVAQLILQANAEGVRGYLKQLRGKVYVTFEEGTQADWLYEVVRPLVTEVVVCDPRHNKLLLSGNKSDRIDAQKLAELLRLGALKGVYHGNKGVRTLKELVRTYDCLVSDTTRVMNRLKASIGAALSPARVMISIVRISGRIGSRSCRNQAPDSGRSFCTSNWRHSSRCGMKPSEKW